MIHIEYVVTCGSVRYFFLESEKALAIAKAFEVLKLFFNGQVKTVPTLTKLETSI